MAVDIPEQIGRYTITRRVGRGGMGVLYQARDNVLDRDVALKVMSTEMMSDEGSRDRFYREARAAARLQHRNIVTVFEFAEAGDAPYIAMEFLHGRSLAEYLASGDSMPLDTRLDIIIQLCEGLQYAHEQGVVHRDVKPANIWLMKDGGVKLLDFGIAKVAGATLTHSGSVVGSAAYSAPEQLSDSLVDGRADIFSAGAVLYELLTGRRPFEAETVTGVMMKILHDTPPSLRTVAPHVPEAVAMAVETALQKNPELRYAHADDFGADLRLARYLTEPAAATVDPPPPVDPGRRQVPVPAPPPNVPPPQPSPTQPPEMIDVDIDIDRAPGRRTRPKAQRLDQRTVAALAIGVSAILLIATVVYFMTRETAPPSYELAIGSTPPGAVIAVNGVATGQRTPATLTLPEKPERVALTLAGFEPVDVPVHASGTGPQHLTYTLKRLLRIESQPAGGRILLDGRDTGLVTPAVVPMAEPRAKTLEVQLTGYQPASQPLTASVIDRGSVRVVLPPPPPAAAVSVLISGDYPFEVSGCGRPSGPAANHTLKVTAPCTLRLRAPDYFLDMTRSVDQRQAGRLEIAAPKLASVQLRSRYEWCTVVIGGRAVGSPPLDLELASGSHNITVQCPERTYVARSFVIEPGRSIRRLDDSLR